MGSAIDDLIRVKNLIDSMPPMPITIWFINRKTQYYRFVYDFEGFTDSKKAIHIFDNRLQGINVIDITEEEIENRIQEGLNQEWIESRKSFQRLLDNKQIYPFRERGVWMQMNKGTHYAIVDNNLIPLDQIEEWEEKSKE